LLLRVRLKRILFLSGAIRPDTQPLNFVENKVEKSGMFFGVEKCGAKNHVKCILHHESTTKKPHSAHSFFHPPFKKPSKNA
jgi:hypothetical protein